VREREDGEKEKRMAHPQTASDLLSNVLDEMSKILIHLSNLYNQIFHALFKEDRKELKNLVKDTEKLNTKSMDMVSELFKTVLIPTVGDEDSVNPNLARTMGSIQELAQQLNELAEKCFKHVDNNHKGMTKDQIDELEKISKDVTDFLQTVSSAIVQKDRVSMEKILEEGNIISKHVKKFDKNQIKRIKRKESKTRISLLYFNMLSFSENIVEHSLKLLRGFSEASVEVLE
jgi:Na+/phosphate symporter